MAVRSRSHVLERLAGMGEALGGSELFSRQAGGGGRNITSCFADSATTSSGFCSFME